MTGNTHGQGEAGPSNSESRDFRRPSPNVPLSASRSPSSSRIHSQSASPSKKSSSTRPDGHLSSLANGPGGRISTASPSSPTFLPYLQAEQPSAINRRQSSRSPPLTAPRYFPNGFTTSPPRSSELNDKRYARQSVASDLASTQVAGPSSSSLRHTPDADHPNSGARRQPKRRPSPLNLADGVSDASGSAKPITSILSMVTPVTGGSFISEADSGSLSNDLQDLSLLRQEVKQNLIARPVVNPLEDQSESGGSSGLHTPDITAPLHTPSLQESAYIEASRAVTMICSNGRVLIIDARPLGEFLDSHISGSINMSIPTLIARRLKKGVGRPVDWETLRSFITTPEAKRIWDDVNPAEGVKILVIGLTVGDEMAKVVYCILEKVLSNDSVKVMRGGWAALHAVPEIRRRLLAEGDTSEELNDEQSTSLPPPKTAPVSDFHGPPPIPPSDPSGASLTHHPSLPSLRTGGPGGARALPSLSLRTPTHSNKRPPKLSLNLDKPLRSASLDSADSGSRRLQNKPSDLTLNVGQANRKNPARQPSSPNPQSLQSLCHAQSKLPPSPSSFRDISVSVTPEIGSQSPGPSRTPWSDAATARPNHYSRYPTTAGEGSRTAGGGQATARSLSPFIVSTILPSFLFLGPEITAVEDVRILHEHGVKRILNVALECNDDEGLNLRTEFDRYHKIPMKDIVEESGVAKGLREACDFLDDARLHSSPTYVHCKAGKSRSVTVVLAYLIHANAWTLKTSYAYVAERRKGISPNIGFVAELMQFEESELGLKQSGGVHGETSAGKSARPQANGDNEESTGSGRHNPRYMRESLPPAWAAASLDTYPRKVPLRDEDESAQASDHEVRRPVADEREVRKNGQWVHHRRAPANRTTLQPGRRVSKAGLESLRGFEGSNSRDSPAPSPRPEGPEHQGTFTPGVDGRLGWV